MDYLSHFEKARKELEDFYLGVPEDSEDLSFDYLAQAQQQKAGPSSDIKKPGPSDPAAETNPRKQEQSAQFHRVSNNSNGGSFQNHHAGGGNERRASQGPHRYVPRACCTIDVHVPTQGDVVIKSSAHEADPKRAQEECRETAR
ncbi:hypothetical protein RHGRI_036127 [Rhododendron griersonianum]|uniref:Uncharacterized protein n=1 Tax=Rhododendron griersonianum TaxID=479676 RepID=A0AAV6HMS7_9ERIC|nr:hypothetical protein RHGRI_036127 [Rhododendron griersonianum]